MGLISEEYRKVLEKTHQTTQWGTQGDMHNAFVSALGFDDVLDYGCGKGALKVNKRYDPAIAEYAADPEPADLVVSFGVLEHVEPECLDDVLAHMASKTKKLCYMTIAPARKDKLILSDGRNAHLIQEDMQWWVDRVSKHFKVTRWGDSKTMGKPKLEIYAEPLGTVPA
jgi:2-polyprenyl-3-methyl-5-hydroxy-6-metoxy-1,4-benzoquinol methylase